MRVGPVAIDHPGLEVGAIPRRPHVVGNGLTVRNGSYYAEGFIDGFQEYADPRYKNLKIAATVTIDGSGAAAIESVLALESVRPPSAGSSA